MSVDDPGPSGAGAPASDPTPVLLALGSNLGDRRRHLARGLASLGREMTVEAVSRVVDSRPWGPVALQPHFLNLVARVRTSLTPESLLDAVRRVEAEAGRSREVPQGPRTLDVDIVFYGDRVIRTAELQIPHPRWRDRPFVANLLPEVAGEMMDPETGRPLVELIGPGPLPPELSEVPPLELDVGGGTPE